MNAPQEFHVTVHSWKKTWVESSYRAVHWAFEKHANYYRTKSDGVLLDFADDAKNGAQARESILDILNTHLDLPWHTMSIDYGRYYPDFKAGFMPTRLLELLVELPLDVHRSALANLIASFVFEPTAIQAADRLASMSSQNEAMPCFTQEILHVEPAAEIPPAEAEQITTLQHAGFIERTLGVAPIPEHYEQVLLLQLNRTSSDLVKALTEGPALSQCRAEMQAERCQFKLAPGAFVFVKPWQYHSAIRAAETKLGLHSLQSSHVIFGQSIEYLLAEALDSVRGGTWAKYQQPLTLDSLSSRMSSVSEVDVGSKNEDVASDKDSDVSVVCIVKNTFLCLAPRSQLSGYSGALSI
jgi:hypothetical protein